jgi:hypothetical protein
MPSGVSVTLLLTIMGMYDNLGAMLYWRSLTGLRMLRALPLISNNIILSLSSSSMTK